MKASVWCRCSVCKHKMFMYEETKDMNAEINIKCSSCKRIMDVVFSGDKVDVKEAIVSE